jgi:hypothetical protein
MPDEGQGSSRREPRRAARISEPASGNVTRSETATPRVSRVAGVPHARPDSAGAAPHRASLHSDASAYRTAGTPSGFFRTPGDFHVHVDGARNLEELFNILSELGAPAEDGKATFPGKFNRVLRFAGGPQRDDRAFAETYRCHTPGSVQKEAFHSFSTIRLGSGTDLESDAVVALRRVLDSVSAQPEAVVELERVIGVLELGGAWDEADPPRIADPAALDSPILSDFRRLTTSPIEIHHSIDIPKNADTGTEKPTVSVDQLPIWPNLGGWFLFDHGECWSFRSSQFVGRTADYHYLSCVGQRRLAEYLAELGYPYALRTLVEQVLGIWRGGEQPEDVRQSIPALGDWEMSCPANGHVWVIAGNFLADRSPDVRRAMLKNLAQDVTYTYSCTRTLMFCGLASLPTT